MSTQSLEITSRALQHPLLDEKQIERVLARIRYAVQSWENTPYREGDCVRGYGVDCVRWTCAVIDHLFGWTRIMPQNLPSDRSLHDRDGAIEVMKLLISIYEPLERVADGQIEPGDILVMAPLGGGPGHAMIAGPDPFTLWHVDPNAGVCRTGFGLTDMELHQILRPEEKHLWLRP